jgi:hypothetical protein
MLDSKLHIHQHVNYTLRKLNYFACFYNNIFFSTFDWQLLLQLILLEFTAWIYRTIRINITFRYLKLAVNQSHILWFWNWNPKDVRVQAG